MNWRATIAAGIIFVALLAFVWVESGYRVAEEGEVFRHSFMGLDLYGIDPAEVTRLEVKRAGEEDLVLHRRGEDWFIVEPIDGLADSDEVTRMVEAVAELRPKASREGVDLRDEQFGLTDAGLIVTLRYDGGTAQLKLGGETPGGTDRYATVSGSSRLYVVGASTRTSLWKNPEDLREKDVAEIETDDVKQVTLDHGEEHIVAVRSEGEEDPKWRLTAPIETAADEWNVKQVINKIGDLRAEGFLSAEEAEEADTGFAEPRAKVTLGLAEGDPLTVTFGNTVTREVGEPPVEQEIVYVRTSRRNEVLIVTADALEGVQKTAFDLRDRSVITLKRDEVTRIHVERAQGLSFTVARRPDGWFVEKPKSFEARQGAVDDLLWNLEDLSATDFVADEVDEQELRQYGLAVPQTVITIELGGRSEPIKVLVGNETEQGMFYATTGKRDQVVKISEFLMGDLPQEIDDLKAAESPEPDGEDDAVTGPAIDAATPDD